MFEVMHDHQVVGSHPDGSTSAPQPNGDLVVTQPDATTRTYPAGTWHGAGEDLVCAFATPNLACPRCFVTPPTPAPS